MTHAIQYKTDGDPYWLNEGTICLFFLSKPRSWAALVEWARLRYHTEDHVRQTLAWLSSRKKARGFFRNKKLYWVGRAWVATPQSEREAFAAEDAADEAAAKTKADAIKAKTDAAAELAAATARLETKDSTEALVSVMMG